jgi:hypothetical protein
VPSLSTIWRILRREGLIVSEPQKRPHCSLIRFQADLPNEMWQADITCWCSAGGHDVEILNLIDDHSRLFLRSDAYPRVKAKDVVQSFHGAAELHGLPASLLSDNGAVFTGSYRGGKVLLESELERLGVAFKNSRPYHPQTRRFIARELVPHESGHMRPRQRRALPRDHVGIGRASCRVDCCARRQPLNLSSNLRAMSGERFACLKVVLLIDGHIKHRFELRRVDGSSLSGEVRDELLKSHERRSRWLRDSRLRLSEEARQ